jgi:hypothetical protein
MKLKMLKLFLLIFTLENGTALKLRNSNLLVGVTLPKNIIESPNSMDKEVGSIGDKNQLINDRKGNKAETTSERLKLNKQDIFTESTQIII